jgi:predicted transcriptional regulator
MTPAQCRAARALIGMSHADLARAAVVTVTIINDFEIGVGGTRPSDVAAIRAALEKAGVEFIDGDRPGVRFSRPQML